MKNKIFSFIKKHNMIIKGDTVICGLSGGADSVSLLLVLNEISKEMDFTLKALHVNHCLRGAESDRDENFCRELCKSLNIPFKAVSCNVTDFAEKNQLSVEESARILRYKIFAENSDVSKIATAHNANDNLETVIFNLARGTALKGISGIPPIRDNIIRPLLAVSRSEIECYLNSLNDCKDGNKLHGLENYQKVIRCRCISRLLSENNLPYSHNRLNDTDNILINGGKINISGDIFFISDGHNAELKKITSVSGKENISADLKIGENYIFSDKIFYCELISREDLKKIYDVHKKLTFYLLDYDKIIGRVILRNRRFGDRIKLDGKNFTSSIKKLINEKIPSEQRAELHFLEDENGTILAEKLGIAERVAPDNKTVRFLKVSIKNK